MCLETATKLSMIFGTVVATFTLIKAVIEFTRQNAQKRAEHYLKLREKFKESGRFDVLIKLIEDDDPTLADLPFHLKRDFLGFYEDIALLVNSGLLRKEVAHYMFAYYAIQCWKSLYFWQSMNRDSVYWRLFRHFVDQMKQVEEELIAKPGSVARYKL